MIRPLTKTLLALAGVGALAATAGAQSMTYNSGDFLLGFRLNGNSATTGNPQTNSVVADIGPIANFSAPSVYTVNLGSTLSAQYGSGWANDPGVFFSLASTDANDTTSYVTSAHYLTGPNANQVKVWARLNPNSSTGFQNKVNNLGFEFAANGTVEAKTDTDAYANFMPGGTKDAGHASVASIGWGYFNPTSEANFGQGAMNTTLDLIQLVPGSGAGTDLGFFQLSNDGNTLTYTPTLGVSVPEPSTYAAIALGALALVGYQTRKVRRSSAQQMA